MADVTIREERVAAAEQHPIETIENQEEPPQETAEGASACAEATPLESSVPEAGPEALPEEPLPKRKPGRPQGSKSKEPGKPRKPRAKKVEFVREEAVESVAVAEQSHRVAAAELHPRELPRATEGSFPIPEEAYDLRAAKMLRLLQMQSDQRKQQKRHVYSNWFR